MCALIFNTLHFQGYGSIQVNGGDGGPLGGGGGSGGRMAIHLAENKTFSGTVDAYGGLGGGGIDTSGRDGSPGTVYYYHSGMYMYEYFYHSGMYIV